MFCIHSRVIHILLANGRYLDQAQNIAPGCNENVGGIYLPTRFENSPIADSVLLSWDVHPSAGDQSDADFVYSAPG
jgi:hypothetical protein